MSMISDLVERLRTEAKSMGTYGTDYMATLLTRSADTIEMLSEKAREPKRGEWVESFKRIEVKRGAYIGAKFVHDGWSCSECSEVVEKRYPNCPYCLARMKGADDEYR